MDKLWKTYKHFMIVPLYFLFYMLVFRYVENRTGVSIHIIRSSLDAYIPFCEYFIIPYFLWFLYVAGAVVYFGLVRKNLSEYYRLIFTLAVGMTLFLVISVIYPNGHVLRPYHFERQNIFVDMVKFLYSIDTSTNVLPSIHVFNSVAVAVAVSDSGAFRDHPKIVRASNVLAILIVCSTVFLKQHTIVDVISALALNALCYRIFYHPRYAYGRKTVAQIR